MKWWELLGKKREEVPESLRELTVDQMTEAVAKSGEIDGLKTQLELAQKQLKDVDAVKARLLELEAAQNPPDKNKGGAPEPESFLVDEDKAFNDRFSAAMGPIMNHMFASQAESAKFQAVQSLTPQKRAMWDKYSGEIDAIMKTVAPAYHGQPATWLRAFNNVLGAHVDDITAAAVGKTEFFAEAPNVGGGGTPPPDPEVLSSEDRKMMERFGLTEDQYKKSKKEMIVRA